MSLKGDNHSKSLSTPFGEQGAWVCLRVTAIPFHVFVPAVFGGWVEELLRAHFLARSACCSPAPLLASTASVCYCSSGARPGWLGARLVGTVCTVSAEPSLSSYTINFFFPNLVGVG